MANQTWLLQNDIDHQSINGCNQVDIPDNKVKVLLGDVKVLLGDVGMVDRECMIHLWSTRAFEQNFDHQYIFGVIDQVQYIDNDVEFVDMFVAHSDQTVTLGNYIIN